jgi:hypothetical protein
LTSSIRVESTLTSAGLAFAEGWNLAATAHMAMKASVSTARQIASV